MKNSREWKQGDTAQRAWADELANRGNCVLPAYAFDDVVRETKAPVMLIPEGLLVTPDVLCMSAENGTTWHEVKSKSVPTWRRLPPGPRWEHGFDYDLLSEYADVQKRTGHAVWIVVCEERRPENPEADSPLILSGLWLVASLSVVLDEGDHRPDWPGGSKEPHRRGRNGRGGWLWARSIMRPMTPLPRAVTPSTTHAEWQISNEPEDYPA